MAIQLDSVVLPDGLLWPDEFTAQSVAQTMKRTLDGTPVVYYGGLSKGRSITLQSASDTGWMTRTQVEALKLLADSPGAVYTLTLRGQNYSVIFRHNEPPAFEATPVVPFATPQAGDFYLASIKLITI